MRTIYFQRAHLLAYLFIMTILKLSSEVI